MKLTLADSKYLKDSISIVSELVSEARFKVTKNGLELVAMDPANVAMVVFNLLSSSFVEYDIQQDTTLAVNLSNMKQILRRAKPNDAVTLELGEDNKLKITLKSNTTRTFSLPVLDFEEKEQKVPELEFPLSITTSPDVLAEAVEDADIVGESVMFTVENGRFTVSAEGDMSHANIEIMSDDNTKIQAGDEKVKSKYSIEYLKKMIPAGKLAPEVSVRFNKDYPLKLEYKAVDKLMLSFILAPRVEND